MLKIRKSLGRYVISSIPRNINIKVRTKHELMQVIQHYFIEKSCKKTCPLCNQIRLKIDSHSEWKRIGKKCKLEPQYLLDKKLKDVL